jgi:hypothetical protein
MDAVLRVDLEARIALVQPHHLIDASRAVALRRFVIQRQVQLIGIEGSFSCRWHGWSSS